MGRHQRLPRGSYREAVLSYTVFKDNVVKLIQPGTVDDQLAEILRQGARTLLAQAVEAEVADFLGKHSELRTEDVTGSPITPRRAARPV
jgi:hypothetical protein